MGNRAVITTKADFENDGIGVYVHWNGGRDSIEAFLKYCELQGYGSPETDCCGWARLCQVIGNFFEGGDSVDIGKICNLDCDNGDNGVYIIENWKVVDRRYGFDHRIRDFDLRGMLMYIDSHMPEDDRLGEAKILDYLAKV